MLLFDGIDEKYFGSTRPRSATSRRNRYALRLGAWCCRRALARMERERYETFVAEARSMPLPAPVLEQMLRAKL